MQPMIKHIVLFKFKRDVDDKMIEKVVEAFRALEEGIDIVRSIEYGKDISPEGLGKGFTDCFIVTFDNVEHRDTYLTHPEHVIFSELVKNHLENICVVDFWGN